MAWLDIREHDVAHASGVSNDRPRYNSSRVGIACRVFAGEDKDATVIKKTSVTIMLLSSYEYNKQVARGDLRARYGHNRLKYHQENRSLTKLSLERNRIDDKGASSLGEALKATFVMCTSCSSPESLLVIPSRASRFHKL